MQVMYHVCTIIHLNLYLVAIANYKHPIYEKVWSLFYTRSNLDSCNFQIHDLEIITEKNEGDSNTYTIIAKHGKIALVKGQ